MTCNCDTTMTRPTLPDTNISTTNIYPKSEYFGHSNCTRRRYRQNTDPALSLNISISTRICYTHGRSIADDYSTNQFPNKENLNTLTPPYTHSHRPIAHAVKLPSFFVSIFLRHQPCESGRRHGTSDMQLTGAGRHQVDGGNYTRDKDA
jgi:hypothetical protein